MSKSSYFRSPLRFQFLSNSPFYPNEAKFYIYTYPLPQSHIVSSLRFRISETNFQRERTTEVRFMWHDRVEVITDITLVSKDLYSITSSWITVNRFSSIQFSQSYITIEEEVDFETLYHFYQLHYIIFK